MLVILSSFFLMLAPKAGAEDLTCSTGLIRKETFGHVSSESSAFCYNGEKTTLVSRDCAEKKCSAFYSHERYSIFELSSEVGKPGFLLCRRLGGKPELIDFSVGDRFFKLDRCLFGDGSFSDTSLLLSFYLKK